VKYLHHIDLEDIISQFLRNVVPVYKTTRRRIPVITVGDVRTMEFHILFLTGISVDTCETDFLSSAPRCMYDGALPTLVSTLG
jgi:hypothetical protein